MENEFVPYEEALALKELGYIGDCLSFYNPTMDGIRMDYFIKKGHADFWSYFGKAMSTVSLSSDSEPMTVEWYQKELDEVALAPLYQQVFKWFREKYKLHGEIERDLDDWCFKITEFSQGNKFLSKGDSELPYKISELECLRKLIEIVKEPQRGIKIIKV